MLAVSLFILYNKSPILTRRYFQAKEILKKPCINSYRAIINRNGWALNHVMRDDRVKPSNVKLPKIIHNKTVIIYFSLK